MRDNGLIGAYRQLFLRGTEIFFRLFYRGKTLESALDTRGVKLRDYVRGGLPVVGYDKVGGVLYGVIFGRIFSRHDLSDFKRSERLCDFFAFFFFASRTGVHTP